MKAGYRKKGVFFLERICRFDKRRLLD